jgi:hypothetical protein
MTDYKQLCAELVDDLELCDWPYKLKETIRADIDRARTELAKPEPERLTVQEISDLPHHGENYIGEHRDGEIQLDGYFSRADLQQLADSIPTH